MGNAETKPTTEKTILFRYTSTVYPYGGGKTLKEYIYISKDYKLEIHPGNKVDPIKPYDTFSWGKITEVPTLLYVKTGLIEEAAEFLKKKENIVNKIQSTLAVSALS